MTHTPGPWRVTYNHTYGQFGTDEKVRDSHNSVICTLHVNSKANGLLIAAAPDMLAALKIAERRIAELARAVCVLAGNPKKVRADDYSEEIRAAITKAETGDRTQ